MWPERGTHLNETRWQRGAQEAWGRRGPESGRHIEHAFTCTLRHTLTNGTARGDAGGKLIVIPLGHLATRYAPASLPTEVWLTSVLSCNETFVGTGWSSAGER